MTRKASLLATIVSASLITGCAPDSQFRPRAVGAQAVLPVGDLVAEGRTNFALNNVALALEQFRRAVRLQPNNIDALNGIAACYDRLGRFDLSSTYYQQALALAPDNSKTLHNFQLSLTMQGRTDEAMALAREAARPRPQAPATPSGDTLVAATGSESVTVALPPLVNPRQDQPRIAEQVAAKRPVPADPAPAVPRLERQSLGEVSLVTASPVRQASTAKKMPAERVVRVTQAELVKQTSTSSEWVFAEAPARPVTAAPPAASPAADLPAPRPNLGKTAAKPSAPAAATPAAIPGPRKPTAQAPRVQLASVATSNSAPVPAARPRPVTVPAKPSASAVSTALEPGRSAPKPRLAKPVMPKPALPTPSVRLATAAVPSPRASVQPIAASSAVRIPKRKPTSAPAPRIRVLNAVGRKGLAGRYSRYLQTRGWAELKTADAARRRNVTVIVYPSGSRAQAAALARRLPFRTAIAPARRGSGSDLMLILGNDALAFDNRLRQRVARA